MIFFIITSFVTALASIYLGFLVYSKNNKNPINRLFLFYTSAVFVWSFSYGVWLLQTDSKGGLFWSRMLNLGATLIPIAYLHWVLVFLKKDKEKKNVLIIGYILTIFFLFFSFSDYYIKGVAPISIFPYWPQAGWLYFLYLFFNYLGMVVYGSYLLYKAIKINSGFYKEQIRYAFGGSIIGFIGGASNFPLMLGINLFPPLGNPLTIAYPLCFAYAIIRHRLMDIKLVLRKSSVYLSSLCTIIILAIIVRYCFAYLGIESDYVDFLILVLSLSLFSPIKHYYYRIANKYFFTSLYDAQKVIADLSEKLRKSLELKTIYGYVSDSLLNAFHAKSIAILIFNEKKGIYTIKFEKGFNFSAKKQFSEDDVLHDLFIKQNKVVIIEELKNSFYDKYKNEIDSIADLNIELMMPLNVKDKNIGLIILGHKESGDMYNDEDLQVLQIVGAQTAIAVENALSYDKVKNFNFKLKKEVEEATAELRAANKKLIELDQTKSDFISIASHQLRTPLTVIKGYISMILEGSFGALTDQENDSLKKVYQSNERLIQLVENLLDISRIESGRLEFNFKEGRLENVVDSVVDELKGNAGAKGLKLEYKKPAKPLPKIIFDEQKIRQVIMNLIDNAIKYTKQGSISVEIGAQGKNINFCVADTGMGVSQSDMPNLFMKFSRGKGVSLVHTSGSGLGLYVGRMMIEAHQGKIWGESAGADKGAKFCFSLPIKNNLINLKVEKKKV